LRSFDAWTQRGSRVSLLATTTASERASHARLVLDLDELARSEWSSLDDYADLRKIPTAEAARRSLFRVKKLLGKNGIELEITQKDYVMYARFGSPAIRELIELDLRLARELLEELEVRREGRPPSRACLEQVLLSPEALAVEYRERRKTFDWIARKHGVGPARIRRLLAATGPVPDRDLRRCVEERLSKHVVGSAVEAAKRGAHVAEIAAILGCCDRTARRFLRRNGFLACMGRPRTSGRPRTW